MWINDEWNYDLDKVKIRIWTYLSLAEPSIWLRSPRVPYSSVVRAFQLVFWKVMGSTPVGELGKSFSEYLTWEHFFIHFQSENTSIKSEIFLFLLHRQHRLILKTLKYSKTEMQLAQETFILHKMWEVQFLEWLSFQCQTHQWLPNVLFHQMNHHGT